MDNRRISNLTNLIEYFDYQLKNQLAVTDF